VGVGRLRGCIVNNCMPHGSKRRLTSGEGTAGCYKMILEGAKKGRWGHTMR
jgi:hypothetical protein